MNAWRVCALLAVLLLPVALSGCQSAAKPAQFSEVPGLTDTPVKPQPTPATLLIRAAKPGIQKPAIVEALRKNLAPPGSGSSPQKAVSDATRLAEALLAGEDVTLRNLPPEVANAMARDLKNAGLSVAISR